MSPKKEKRVLFCDLRDTYHELGSFQFKIVLNSKHFPECSSLDVSLTDSDGKPLNFQRRNWGRKIFCDFIIDERVADGVSWISLSGSDIKGNEIKEKAYFWVIK